MYMWFVCVLYAWMDENVWVCVHVCAWLVYTFVHRVCVFVCKLCVCVSGEGEGSKILAA